MGTSQPLLIPVSVRFDKESSDWSFPIHLATPVSQPDLCLRVYTYPLDQGASRLRLEYVLYSPHRQLRLPGVPMVLPKCLLRSLRVCALGLTAYYVAPPNWFRGTLYRIKVGRPGALFTDFLSRASGDLSAVSEKATSWLILCDADPWIPWELAKPTAGWEHDFLAARYRLGRWWKDGGVSPAEVPIGQSILRQMPGS